MNISSILSPSLTVAVLVLFAIPAIAQPPRPEISKRIPVQDRIPGVGDLHLIDDVEPGFVALFDGQSLDGWEQKNGQATYEVVDGTIMGRTVKGSPNSFLCTVEEYSDFDLRFQVKVDVGLNSGVQIRSLSKPGYKQGRVHGNPATSTQKGLAENGSVPNRPRRWLSKTMIGIIIESWPMARGFKPGSTERQSKTF